MHIETKWLTARGFEQVHADSSAFAAGLSKSEVYAQVLEQARLLFDGQRNWVRSTGKNGITIIFLAIIHTEFCYITNAHVI